MGSDLQPLTRFTRRVGDYVRYRPDYPAAVFDWLAENAGLGPDTMTADIGAGTGIFTGQLLARGATVFAVEPNAAMRAAAEERCGGIDRFVSVDGTAEDTGLLDHIATLITSAQAFHWFDPAGARREFQRISRPGAHWAVVWNTSDTDRTPFACGYERIKEEFGTDLERVRHDGPERSQRFDLFFGPGAWRRETFPHHQMLDRDGLKGRMKSSSYAPMPDDPRHGPMMAALDRLFDEHEEGGFVRMDYTTELFVGGPAGAV